MARVNHDYGIVIAKDVMIPMRDGVRLAADIYRPAIDGEPIAGQFPTILGRTSYDKNSPQMWVAPVGEFFCRHGYAVVIQDLRGRHHSEGTGQYFHTVNPIGPGMNPFYVSPRARMRSIVLDGGAHQKEEAGIVGARPPYLPLSTRPDVLVFQTEPLADAIEVTGLILVQLWISSSAVDTDFTAKLVDVYPPNPDYPESYHLNLVDSIIRTRYRDSWESEKLMAPGEIYRVKIQLPPTSNLFAVGHRLRLDISSSNFPRFDVNPNTGEPMGRHTHAVVANNAVHADREHPSHVILPVVPRDSHHHAP